MTEIKSAVGAEYGAIDNIADDARQYDDEGVDDALDQGERHHVAI
jgi:hypothetical protein